MARRIARHPRLVDRDYDILQHLRLYHLTTREVLHRLFFQDAELNAVTKVTSRLVDHGFLNRYELPGGRSYFVFGNEGVKLFGASPKHTRAFGAQALPREYGILHFCCMSQPPREKLPTGEVLAKMPDVQGKRLDPSHYYLDRDGENTRLGHMRVVLSGPPDYIVRKCREDVEAYQGCASLSDLIAKDKLLLALLVATPERAAVTKEALLKHRWPLRFRVEVVAELTHVLAPLPSILS